MSAADELRALAIFADLTDEQLTELLDVADVMTIVPGDDLFLEGHPADNWWAVISGTIDLVRRMGREYAVVAQLVPGRWAGGFKAWDEHGVYLATGRGAAGGSVLKLPATELRRLSNRWSPFGGHLIAGLYGTARTIEATARQRESLVALGTLAAGLAHEINNPAAAATRAVADLEQVTATVEAQLRRLAEADITASEYAALDALRTELAAGPAPVLDPLDASDLEDDIAQWLEDRDVDRGWLLADPLAAAGASIDWLDRVRAAVPKAALEPSLEWIAAALSVTSLLGEVKESTGRISKLIDAVKSYSQMDRAALQVIDVTEGLESTLVMLGPHLNGITVERAYEAGLPQIEAYAGELNQVWTNLIDNALDAMGGTGTLRLATRLVADAESSYGLATADRVCVEVTDTGPGMSADVAARAFDAFFTTKDVGDGVGLGLDVARRIVAERHGGSIAIDSQPGRTVLRVKLPIALRARTS